MKLGNVVLSLPMRRQKIIFKNMAADKAYNKARALKVMFTEPKQLDFVVNIRGFGSYSAYCSSDPTKKTV